MKLYKPEEEAVGKHKPMVGFGAGAGAAAAVAAAETNASRGGTGSCASYSGTSSGAGGGGGWGSAPEGSGIGERMRKSVLYGTLHPSVLYSAMLFSLEGETPQVAQVHDDGFLVTKSCFFADAGISFVVVRVNVSYSNAKIITYDVIVVSLKRSALRCIVVCCRPLCCPKLPRVLLYMFRSCTSFRCRVIVDVDFLCTVVRCPSVVQTIFWDRDGGTIRRQSSLLDHAANRLRTRNHCTPWRCPRCGTSTCAVVGNKSSFFFTGT